MSASPAAGNTLLPAFVNTASGSTRAVLAALRSDDRFAVHETAPHAVADALRAAAAAGARRVVVAGGDGTLVCAAAAAAETGVELAVLPGGTLNHFARDLGLPVGDLGACLDIAANGTPRRVDLGEVNGHWILNSSSVGVYVTFVRTRERLERWLSYMAASVVAALRVWLTGGGLRVEVRASPAAGTRADAQPPRSYHTPLVFVGVGERDMAHRSPTLRLRDGRRALHAIVVRRSTRAHVAAVAWSALMRGLDSASRAGALDALLVDECVVHLRQDWVTVAIDGELLHMRAPLHYRLWREAFTVVGPE